MTANQSERYVKEIKHIQFGPEENEKSEGIGTVEFEVACEGNCWEILRKAKEILNIVSKAGISSWPSDNEWSKLLPQWFVDRCAPEMSEEEFQNWQEFWNSLTWGKKTEIEKKRDWSLLSWLYWMRPDNRAWFWWDAIEKNPNLLLVYVEVDEWPFPWGSLRWLFRAVGAQDIKSEEEKF